VQRDIFVSYSQPDHECAFALVQRLEARGLSVFIAPRDISPAAEWAAEIIDAIAAARIMVLVFSSHSNASPQVRREVERAVHKEVPVLPFRIENLLPSKSLEYFLSSQHWLDGFPEPREPHYERLCAHVAGLLQSPAAAPAPAAQGSARAVAAAFSPAQLEGVERLLAHHIGPLAHHLVGRAAGTAGDWDQLLQKLAGEIDAEVPRRQFLDACHRLTRSGP
jgi:hypothetical protein